MVFILSFSFINSGCKQETTPEETETVEVAETEEEEEVSEAQEEEEEVTITWWVGSWKVEAGIAQQAIEEFEKEYPNINVEVTPVPWEGMYEKYLSALMAKKGGPDIITYGCQWGQEFAASGGLADLSDLWAEVSSSVFESTHEWNEFEGKQYGIPFRIETWCLYYNKTMFEKAGLNNPPKTWAQVAEYAKKITTEDVYGLGEPLDKSLQTSLNFRPVIYSFGGDFISADQTKATFNTEEAKNAIRYYYDLFVTNKVLPPDSLSWNTDAVTQAFAAGTVGMNFDGPWGQGPYNDAGLDYGVAMIPGIDENTPGYWEIMGLSYSIPMASENKDAAYEFIKFLLRPEIDSYVSFTLPAVKEAANLPKYQEDQISQIFFEQFNYPIPMIKLTKSAAIYEAVAFGLQRVILGDDLETVANEVNDEIQVLIDES